MPCVTPDLIKRGKTRLINTLLGSTICGFLYLLEPDVAICLYLIATPLQEAAYLLIDWGHRRKETSKREQFHERM